MHIYICIYPHTYKQKIPQRAPIQTNISVSERVFIYVYRYRERKTLYIKGKKMNLLEREIECGNAVMKWEFQTPIAEDGDEERSAEKSRREKRRKERESG